MVTIYVYLPEEMVNVWAPVDAEHVRDDIYRIENCRGEDEAVEFGKGQLVRCRHRTLSGRDVLVAFEEA